MNNPFIQMRCGNCQFWMIFGECPKEVKTYGGHMGPHNRDFCQKFVFSNGSLTEAERWEKEHGEPNEG